MKSGEGEERVEGGRGWGGRVWLLLIVLVSLLCVSPVLAAGDADRSTHQSDHSEDEEIIQLDPIHVHGLPLNRDRQKGPVTNQVPYLQAPPSLAGKELDDWMKVRVVVDKSGKSTVVVLEPAKHRELTSAALTTIEKWKWEPQLREDEPIDGEVTIRVHFRTQ